jgi:hypothetical protein
MKHSRPVRTTAAQRESRVAAVVAKARARGEKIPKGVKLIGFRNVPTAARAHGATLVPLARKCLSSSKAAAA